MTAEHAPIEPGRCAVCGQAALQPHLRVAGEIGELGLIPSTDSYGTALSDIARCTRCGHMQLETFPSAAELDDAYADAASADYVEEEAGQRATAAAVLERIERYVEPGRLLDLGCWVGFLLAEARDRGWEGIGIEPSEYAAAYAHDHLGLEVRNVGLFEAELPAQGFDAVFLGDVIEHIPDAGAALDLIHAALAPGGVVALALPDAGSRLARAMGARWWSVLPTHVHYFTRASVTLLLRERGFDPLLVATAPKAFTVSYYLNRLGGYSESLAAALAGGAESLGIADRIWAPDFRDRMLVIARVS